MVFKKNYRRKTGRYAQRDNLLTSKRDYLIIAGMKKILLQDYVAAHKQKAAASVLGCHQTNISLMLKKDDRTFTLCFDNDGKFIKCIEEKIFCDAATSC